MRGEGRGARGEQWFGQGCDGPGEIGAMRGNRSQQFPVSLVFAVAFCLAWTALGERFLVVCCADESAPPIETQPAESKARPLVSTESAVPADQPVAPTQAPGVADEKIESAVAEREHKAQLRQQLQRGFAILLVLVLLAVFVMTMFLLWGIRLRRRLRKPLPAIHKGDELWFLKPATQKPDDNPPDTPQTNPNGG